DCNAAVWQPAGEPRLEQSEAADGRPRQVGGERTDDFFPSHTHPIISLAPLLRGSSTGDWISSSLWPLAAAAAFPTVSGHGGSLHYFRWVDPAVAVAVATAVAAAEGGSGGSRWWWCR
ncbi:Os12g0219700, partial [Oryza sativa Japonica Group]